MPNKYDAEYIYTKYIELVEPRLNDIECMVADGLTYGQIAKELHIDNSLLWAMRQNKPFTQLRQALKIKAVNIENVENALYRKAIGFFYEEEQAIKVKQTYTNKDGKRGTKEDVKVVKVQRYCEPDVSAIKFLLINKDADNYHAESQKPVDNSMDVMLEKASEIVVSVKKTADSGADNG